MAKLPTVRQGMEWRDMSAADFNYLVQQVRKSLNLQVGPGLLLRHMGDAMHLNLARAFTPRLAEAAAEAGAQIKPVVLVTGASDLLEVRAVAYATEDQPITEAEYVWAGEKFKAYPDFGARYQDYVGLVSPDDPPNVNTEFLLAYRVGPIWVVALQAAAQIKPVVLVTGASDLLEVRAVRYAESPPTEVEYDWDGEKFEVYPDFGARYQDYVGLVSPDDPPNANTEFLLAYRVGPIWVVALPVAPFEIAHAKVAFTSDWHTRHGGDVVTGQFTEVRDGQIFGTGDVFNIARFYDVRRSPFDGIAPGNGYQYTYSGVGLTRRSESVTDPDDFELQEITPSYYPGEVIAIAKMETFVEGVEWQELNARRWGKVLS